MFGAIGGFVKTYAVFLIIGAVVAGLSLIGASYYWMYSKGAATERAVCSSKLAAKDLQIAEASEKARVEQRKKDAAALDIVADMLTDTEAKLAAERGKRFAADACHALTQEEADAINGP